VPLVSISKGSTGAVVSTRGAHVVSVSLNGERAIKPSGDGAQTHGGAAVLIPYAGRVNLGKYEFEGMRYRLQVGREGHAIHGFAKDAGWDVAEEGGRVVALESRLSGEGYPSELRIRIVYSVWNGGFSTKCSVTNEGVGDCPLVVGFHPYFVARGWKISAAGRVYRYLLRDTYFPTGRRVRYSFGGAGPDTPLDDCFMVGGTVRLWTGSRTLEIRRRAMPYLMVYNGKYAEGKSVAIEPYTGLPDAYNNGIGLRVLKPRQRFGCGYDAVLRR
jgi:aldose 1-epimerase